MLKSTISFFFEKHIPTLVKKASNELNAISRIKKFMGFKKKEILLNSFVYLNFNYCPLVCHFGPEKSAKKIEKYRNELLEYFTTTFPVISLS